MLVPGVSITKGGKVGKLVDGVQEIATKGMDKVKDLNKVLQSSDRFNGFPNLNPFLITPEGVPFKVGKITPDTNPLPKTSVQEHYINEMDGLGDGSVGRLEGLGDGGSNKTFEDSPFDEAGKLNPNVKYKAGEHQYDYETDHMGRIENFSTDDLKLTTRDERLPHDSNTPGKEPGDHAGHLAGDRFGGSPEIDNLVSQSSKINLSEYKKIENEWARALQANPPKHVSVEVKVNYDGDSLRPSGFKVVYEIDGRTKVVDLVN